MAKKSSSAGWVFAIAVGAVGGELVRRAYCEYEGNRMIKWAFYGEHPTGGPQAALAKAERVNTGARA